MKIVGLSIMFVLGLSIAAQAKAIIPIAALKLTEDNERNLNNLKVGERMPLTFWAGTRPFGVICQVIRENRWIIRLENCQLTLE